MNSLSKKFLDSILILNFQREPLGFALAFLWQQQTNFSGNFPLQALTLHSPTNQQISLPLLRLPATLQMAGTLRTFSPEWRQKAKEHIERISSALATATNTDLSLRINEGYPALWNDPATTEEVLSLAQQLFSRECVVPIQPKLWAEDFAYYTRYAAGCFWTLGVRSKAATEAAGLHTPLFNPSESAFLYGAQLLTAIPWACNPASHSEHCYSQIHSSLQIQNPRL